MHMHVNYHQNAPFKGLFHPAEEMTEPVADRPAGVKPDE
jgi:hypothetical protein